MGVAGIEFNGALQEFLRPGVVLLLAAVVEDLAGQHAFVGRHVVGRRVAGAIMAVGFDPTGKGGGDRRRNLVLDGEDVL